MTLYKKYKKYDICVIGVPEEQEEKKEETLFDEIIIEIKGIKQQI